jgi:membrane protease YdiL (CAAX protease family)
MDEPKLGALGALAAYVALLAGMFFIGFQSQMRNVVLGLWTTEALAIALPAAFVLCVAGVRLGSYLGFRKISWKQGLVALVVSAANQPVVSLLTWGERAVLPKHFIDDFDDKQRMLDTIFAGRAGWMIVTVMIAAPLGEELFFRGYLLPALRKSWGIVAALLVSSALFSTLHADPVGFLGLMEIGIVLAALRLWSGSLWAAIVGHAVNNGIAACAFVLGYQDPDLPTPPWVLGLGAVLLVVGTALLVKVLRRAPPLREEHVPPRLSAGGALGFVWTVALAAGIIAFVKPWH